VDPPRIELGFPPCESGVVPLDHEPMLFRGPSGSCTQSSALPKRRAASCTYRPKSDPGWNRTIAFLDVGQASSPLDHGIMSVTEEGVEPTNTRLSTSSICQFAYPVIIQ